MAAEDDLAESARFTAGSHPELSSISTMLDDVMTRLSAIAESAASDEKPFAAELFEIERDLQAGSRRLAKLVGDADRSR